MKPKQSIPKELRYTVADFNAEFPSDDSCLEYIKEQRWPNGVTKCEKCGVERKHYRVSGRTAFACDHCGNHVYPLKESIFQKTTTSLRLWFYAMYLMGSTRCGISAKQIQRETGVTYKTAWRMFRQIRSLLSECDMQLEGASVEMDEVYIGGTVGEMHLALEDEADLTAAQAIARQKQRGKELYPDMPDWIFSAPEKACANLRRLANDGRLGAYGFYEAVDYTPARLPRGQTSATVRRNHNQIGVAFAGHPHNFGGRIAMADYFLDFEAVQFLAICKSWQFAFG